MTTVDSSDSAGAEPAPAGPGREFGPEHLHTLAAILDEHTFSVLSAIGVTAGSQCLDVGAGAGTVTAWLASRVAPGGRVTALDLDTSHVRASGTVTALTGDVGTVALPDDHFDLIHARLVLLHLPERELVLRRLVAALKPGGTLVISDWGDRPGARMLRTPYPAAIAAFEAYQSAVAEILQFDGADLGWARRVPVVMRAAGLVEVGAVVHNRLWTGGTAGCRLHINESHRLHDRLLARGVTDPQLELLRAALADPRTLAYGHLLYTSTGRKPARPELAAG